MRYNLIFLRGRLYEGFYNDFGKIRKNVQGDFVYLPILPQ